MTLRHVPFFDLIGQWLACGGESDIIAIGFDLAESKVALVQPHQQRKVLLGSRGRKIRAIRCGENGKRPGMLPALVLGGGWLHRHQCEQPRSHWFRQVVCHGMV
jgi:hypothetical protein